MLIIRLLILTLIEELVDESADYSAHFFQDKPSIQTHWGVFAEFVSLDALEKIHSITGRKDLSRACHQLRVLKPSALQYKQNQSSNLMSCK